MEEKKLRPGELDWDSGLPATCSENDYYEEAIANAAVEDDSWKQALTFLETIFLPGDNVSFVQKTMTKEDGRLAPGNFGLVLERDRIIKDLKKSKKIEDAFCTFSPEAGAWIRFNPIEGKDAVAFRYTLIKTEGKSLEEQKKMLVNFGLPIAALIEGGGDTLHAIVKIGAKDKSEYTQRVNFLHDWLAKHNFMVDRANGSPTRLTRLPGVMRNGKMQKLVAVNLGCSNWLEWKDEIEGIDDDLPQTVSFYDQVKTPPPLKSEVIYGMLREQGTCMIIGDSKCGKTCFGLNLAICMALGRPFLGKWQCKKGKVLYINFEVEEGELYDRMSRVFGALEVPLKDPGTKNLDVWNLRGHVMPLEQLTPKIIRRSRSQGPYQAIFLDPIYLCMAGRDENSAEAVTLFLKYVHIIAHETGAAVIYMHHHPKGYAGERKLIDRGAGSGTHVRSADTVLDLSMLDPSEDIKEAIKHSGIEKERAMQLGFVVRSFPDIDPINVFFKFPLHYIDKEGLLEGAAVEGSREANLQKSSKRTTSEDRHAKLVNAYMNCRDQDTGYATLQEMSEWSGISEKSLRRYASEFYQEFTITDGKVKRKSVTPLTDHIPELPKSDPDEIEAQRQQLTKEFEELSREKGDKI